MSRKKFTIHDFNLKYPNEKACLDGLFRARYGLLRKCPKCKKATKFHHIKKRKCYCCQFCGHQLHPTAGTIFHKSSTSLKSWFFAIYLFSVSKNGVSAKELERQLGVTYKCAWRIAKQIRKFFSQNKKALKGIVEIDETYVGGRETNRPKSKRRKKAHAGKYKIPVVGMVERKGEMKAKVTKNAHKSTVVPLIRENVKLETRLMTDSSPMYQGIRGYKQESVCHTNEEYVRGDVYTNTLEGFWSQLKRSINGTYHAVSPKYLQSYVNEFVYRYNHRHSQVPLFWNLVQLASQPVR